jgi:hypothetical protein
MIYRSEDAIERDFKDGKINEGRAFTELVDLMMENDNLEYDDRGMPDFKDAHKRVNKTINRWKADMNGEKRGEMLF